MGGHATIKGAFAFLVGCIVAEVEIFTAGLLSQHYLPVPVPHDFGERAFFLQQLTLSVLLTWSLASLAGAWLLALIVPRRWGLYSACAAVPVALAALAGVLQLPQGVPAGYLLLSGLVRVALVPLFLALIYATFRRQAGSQF